MHIFKSYLESDLETRKLIACSPLLSSKGMHSLILVTSRIILSTLTAKILDIPFHITQQPLPFVINNKTSTPYYQNPGSTPALDNSAKQLTFLINSTLTQYSYIMVRHLRNALM